MTDGRYHSPKMPKSFSRTRKNSAIGDLLCMVDIEVPEDVLAGWTDEQAYLAQHWAWKSHLRASDNIVKVPPEPDFLVRWTVVAVFTGPSLRDVTRVPRTERTAPDA